MKFLLCALFACSMLFAQTTASIDGSSINVETKFKNIKSDTLDELVNKVEKTFEALPFVYSFQKVKENKVKETKKEVSKDISYYVITNLPKYEYVHITLNYLYEKCDEDDSETTTTTTTTVSSNNKSDKDCGFDFTIKPKNNISFMTESHEFAKNLFNKDHISSTITLDCDDSKCELDNDFAVENLNLINWVQKAAKTMGMKDLPNIQQVLKTTQRSMVDFNKQFVKVVTQ